MKKRYYLFGTLLCLSLAMLQSCDNNDDDYVLGKDWATVRTTGSGSYYLEGDTWGIIEPVSSLSWFKAVDGERVLTYFEPLTETDKGVQANIEGLQEILTKGVEVMTAENEAEFGNDPIVIYEGFMWLGGKYLNVVFEQALPHSQKHRISLVQNMINDDTPDQEGKPIVGEDGYMHLDLRYNTFGDTTGFKGVGRVSFNLSNYYPTEENSKIKGFKVTINSKENGEGRVIVLNFNEPIGIPEAAKAAHSNSLLQ